MAIRRRDLLRLGIGGGAGLLAAGARARQPGTTPDPQAPDPPQGGTYGRGVEPPRGLGAHALDARLLPPPPRPDGGPPVRHEAEFFINERSVEVARDALFDAWTYNGEIPGPILRAREGDSLQLRFHNTGAHPHNVHFHGRHAVDQDGWQPVAAGDREQYLLRAEPFGLHPYHCHALPVSRHVAKGLYGLLIVDPPENRPPAREIVLVLCGFDLDGDGRSDLYAWNGVAGYYARFPIRVAVGELVRVYLLNMVGDDPVGSFHLHAETFDVYRSGTRLEPDQHTDVVTLGQAERAIVEFRLPARGRYMFHPHQIHMAEAGALGWFSAV